MTIKRVYAIYSREEGKEEENVIKKLLKSVIYTRFVFTISVIFPYDRHQSRRQLVHKFYDLIEIARKCQPHFNV